VVRVTGNFTSESPINPAAKSALLAAFDQGWADPKKLSQASRTAAQLRNRAIESIATRLGIAPHSCEIIGEPSLGHFLGIAGFLSPQRKLYFSAIDQGKVRAVARAHTGTVEEIAVTDQGQIIYPKNIATDAVISWQLANSETGAIQSKADEFEVFKYRYVDATAAGGQVALPENWSSALFDARSWGGPAGLAILAIRQERSYDYPLPKIAPIKSPGSYSLPLLLGAAVALENYEPASQETRGHLLRKISSLPNEIAAVAPDTPALANKISLVIADVSGEQLVAQLAKEGFDVDSGSACSPEDLQPSHVLAAMGYPTNGHIRLTLHPGTTIVEVDQLIAKISQVRRQLLG
jgi:cysteine desulfurase